MVGALSIIRFRTAVKDAKDSAFIFWAISIGLSCGSGIYIISILGSIIIAVILFFFYKGVMDDTNYLVVVHAMVEADENKITEIVEKYCSKTVLKMKNTSASALDITYEVSFKKGNEKNLTSDIMKLGGISAVNIVTYNGEVAG